MSATAASLHRDHAGRFTPRRTDWPACTECGCLLAEDLVGRHYCALRRCDQYRMAVDVAPGVNAGTLTAEMLEVQ